ncbi:MAG: AarF/ABC1/UbiB kinase family protein [Nocardiopsaceae bacterium]|nr:AarF/ABC1/UbiB kinase family protein [Nocardiopsaceae bacterium]
MNGHGDPGPHDGPHDRKEAREEGRTKASVARLRVARGVAAARLAVRGGARYTRNAPKLFRAAGQQRQQLRNDLALRTAEDVTATLGAMKGVLMKLGQMASYIDDGLNPAVRRTLGRLQDSVPPMSPELAAGVIRDELGAAPDSVFKEWDPEPIAAASIGQVHRAITADGRAVAVKVQYPGIAETISADLGNVALLRSLLKAAAPGQDVSGLITELRERIGEELDYEREAANQAMFAAFYDGHPTIGVPKVIDGLCTKRVITSDLAAGARFAEMLTWPQREKDLAAETIYRFVFRSVYEAHAFNGDPHPGNYLFERGGRVTFLDYGLVKRFSQEELKPLEDMVRTLCVEEDPEGFRQAMTEAGFLAPDAPVSTDQVIEEMSVFYESVRSRSGPTTMTSEYATRVTRKFFDFRSPISAYASIPPAYVIIQRINLGMFSVLAEMNATGDWRALAEEIWPFFQGPPSTPMGEAEAAWKAASALPLRRRARGWEPASCRG